MKKASMIIGFVGISTLAFGAPPSVTFAGITVGQPLQSYPDCPGGYPSQAELPCQRFINAPDQETKDYLISLRSADAPALMAEDQILTRVRDGIVQSIGFSTLGNEHQDDVLAQLREKFGPPNKVGAVVKQNGFGATFNSITATWQIGDVQVAFAGLGASPETGFISARTADEIRRPTSIPGNHL